MPFVTQTDLRWVFWEKATNRMWIDAKKPHSITNLFNIENGSQGLSDYFIAYIDSENLDISIDEKSWFRPDYRWDGSNLGGLISPSDMQKLRNLKEDDNPVIVLFKLKSE